jgi:DNA-binding MarR family transcriptional regulator
MTTIRSTAPLAADRGVLTASIIAQFRAAMRELRCMSGDRMRRTEVSFAQVHILSMLDRHGDMPMSRLADKLDVSLSNASGVIDRLEERGFVERLRVPDDRRVVLVRATDGGRAALARAEVLKDELMRAILERLDDRRLARLAAALDDVRTSAEEVFATDPALGLHDHIHDHAEPHAEPLPATASPV